MDNIEMYQDSYVLLMNEIPRKICSWVVVLVISLILFISLSICFKYKKYLTYEAVIQNGHIEFYVDKKFFSKVADKTVVIERNKYRYTVIAIEEYSYDMGVANYWKVVIDANISDEWIIENNRLVLSFLEKEQTFAENIINKIKKGIEQ